MDILVPFYGDDAFHITYVGHACFRHRAEKEYTERDGNDEQGEKENLVVEYVPDALIV